MEDGHFALCLAVRLRVCCRHAAIGDRYRVEKTVSDPILAPGGAVEFMVTVRNLGPFVANTVHVIEFYRRSS